MSKAKFTNGEWSVVDGKIVMCDGLKIAYAYSGHAIPYLQDISANAHLIAAAPEMYEMLQALVDGDSINDSSIDLEVLSLLAKARGETK